jgi:PAS domain S-box-containing protein
MDIGPNPDDQTLARLYRLQIRDLEDVAMFVMDTQGTLQTWNQAVQNTLGYSEEEWIGRDADLIFTEEDRASGVPQSEMRNAAERGRTSDIRWHVRKDGSRVYMVGILKALRDEVGRLLGYAKVIIDDTARKRLEDALTQSNADLQQFAFIASHDLQEPLRTVRSYAELLERRYAGQLGTEGTEFVQRIVSSATRMSTLVADLLHYARLEHEEYDAVSIHLDEDFDTAVHLLRSSIEEARAVITHDPLPRVRLHHAQTVRLFQNLLSNSLKFRNLGEAPRIHISAEKRERDWLIRVRDNGIGFAPEHAEAIFTPFRRLHSTGDYPGSGIGLATCRRIVERFGGQIGAEAEPGRGATFWFTVPLALDAEDLVAGQDSKPDV